MSMLKRLKSMLTGEKEESEEDNKQKSSESSTPTSKKPKSTEATPKKEETPVKKTESTKEAVKPAETKEVEEPSKKGKESKTPVVTEEEKPKPERSERMSLLQKDENLLKRDAIDKEFSEKIKAAGGDSLEYCFQCGTCTGSCPSGRRTPYRIRQIVRKTNMGLKDDVIADPSLWMCTTCYACQERCPRGIKIVDVVKLARNEAAQAGFMAPAHKMTGKFVIESGHGVPINDATMELRKRVGLSELPPTTHTYPEALEEVQTILKSTGFDSLIGYNWESKDLE
ncbi:CoB--CoM heterodisulfide reductase subunit C [Methanobacterium alcaliphilum]|uniref:CoB--CoM heterodisulfide reductase subunit C n=1 Tax=Methanobacterium alcaliphilum TaxID=392018 RepID=UPI00200A2271|nr:CoB--CoM heterodisulfide reductase subunit C [Methanobacterium alcaliphilum]MCK9151269.1 CoB--CoM heterodisulfide reductase subunit C [Methanobacterium alcaliphilum]